MKPATRTALVAVVAAFLTGILVMVVASLALGDDGDQTPHAIAVEATPTAEATHTPAPAATERMMETPLPTAAPATQTPVPSPIATPAENTSVAVQQAPGAAPSPAVFEAAPGPPAPGSGYAFIGAVWADEFIPIPYCVNPANPPVSSDGSPLMSDAAFVQTVQHAFQTWQDVPGSYVSFAYQGICQNDPFQTRDQVNTVGWGWLFSSAIGVAAPSATHGEFLRQSTFGQIYEFDIVVDVRYAQSFDDEAEYINRALPWVLLHEVGHFIGLDHSEDPCSIMQPVIVETGPALCEVDRAGARALYPE